MIQKHDARNLHFDLRLEVDGVFKSWAVPRGPSLDPKQKRLAVEVEDHPLEYGSFEGEIPAGQYGAGRVIVWDRGKWEPSEEPEAALAAGKLKFRLFGERLQGQWLLVRTSQKGKQPQWLLSKLADPWADPTIDVTKQFVESVISNRSIQATGKLPSFIDPKLPTLVDTPPSGTEWIHELKLDGYRMQAHWGHDGFRLLTRSGVDWTARFPEDASDLKRLKLHDTILDGELTALGADGRSDFSMLQQAAKGSRSTIAFFAFDLLFHHGEDCRGQTLLERKRRLKALIAEWHDRTNATRLQFLDHVQHDPARLLERCQEMGLEGIVSKRGEGMYVSGRAADWLKTKLRYRETLVVGGYEVTGKGDALSSLLLGYFDRENRLCFAGRVGTGWSDRQATGIVDALQRHVTTKCPFGTGSVSGKPSRWRSTKDSKTRTVWSSGAAGAEITFSGWTGSKQVRHASFVSLIHSVNASEVTEARLFADRATSSSTMSCTSLSASNGKMRTEPSPKKIPSKGFLPGLTHRDRVLFPANGTTKEDLASYLFQVSRWLLPHIEDRPLSLVRCPEGIGGQRYFQRHPQKGFPREIQSLAIEDETSPLLMIEDTQGLLATAQISAIELHPWGCRRDRIDRPDRVIVDLDPDPELAWTTVVEAAFIVRASLLERGLESFVKTTGGKGLHVVVPIRRRPSWDAVFDFTKSFAERMAKEHPGLFVANMSKARRRYRIFLDYHRNRRGATAIAPYSVRAHEGATVATPVSWNELPTITPGEFNLQTVPARLANLDEDPWRGIHQVKQSL